MFLWIQSSVWGFSGGTASQFVTFLHCAPHWDVLPDKCGIYRCWETRRGAPSLPGVPPTSYVQDASTVGSSGISYLQYQVWVYVQRRARDVVFKSHLCLIFNFTLRLEIFPLIGRGVSWLNAWHDSQLRRGGGDRAQCLSPFAAACSDENLLVPDCSLQYGQQYTALSRYMSC